MPRFPWQRQRDNTPDPRTIDTALDQFLSAKTWDATRAQLEAQQSLLLSDAAIATLQRRIVTHQAQPDAPGPATDVLTLHLHLLETACNQGIPAAWDIFQADLHKEREGEIAVITQLLEPDLQPQAPSAYQQSPDTQGTPLTIPPLLQPLIDEINALVLPHEMTQKIALCQQEIQRIDAGEGDRLLWATAQRELGNALWQNPQGDRAENLERAIAAYQAALQVLTRDAFPVNWAMTQNNLGISWSERILGNKAQNLEHAIATYQAALQVRTRDAFPVEWALTQNNLGNAWGDRILGDIILNLERAIAAYQAALQVLTRDAYPFNWAMTQNNLGNAWGDRILGDKAQNLELAIAAHQAALQVYTRDAFSVQWAGTQNNLGNAWSQRILGDKAQNLELALAAYQAALQVYTRDAFPVEWAMTQNNVGLVLSNRILGDKAQNLDLAIAAYQAAVQVYTRDAFPVDWATTQNNLGNVWRERILGDKAQNLELALTAHNAAVQVRTRDAFPVQWARTQNSLGNVWRERILGDKAQNLELALTAYKDALRVLTRDAYPFNWARTQNNLGNAWSDRILGDKAQNLELAIAAYQAAVQVYTRDAAFSMEYRDTQGNLAGAYEAHGDWHHAHLAYLAARDVQRDLVALATSEETRTATIAAGADHDYYLRDVRVLARHDPFDLAAMAEALEEGRAQSIRAALDLDAIDLRQIADTAAHARAEVFIAARDAWRAAQLSSSIPISGSLTPHDGSMLTAQRSDAIQSAHHAFERARDAIRQHDNPDFLSPVSHLHDIAQAVTLSGNSPNEAVVYLAAGPEVGLALIVLRDGRGVPQVRYVPLPRFTDENTLRLIQNEASHRGQEIICGGLAQAQMGWGYEHLQEWGESPHEALVSLPPSSGFAVALLRLQAAWRTAPKLLALLETTFETLAQDEQVEATLAGAFTDMLLRVELDRSLTVLGDLGLTDLAHALAVERDIQRVALVPYGRLALFPLPAVLVSHEGYMKRLADCFEMTIAPSARALTVAKARAAESDRQRQQHTPEWQRRAILAAGNPQPLAWKNSNLPYAEAEADTIRRIAKGYGAPEGDVLKYTLEQATRKHVLAGLGRAWYAHLAMHGHYHQEEPRQSRIFLAGDANVSESERTITLAECLEGKVDLVGLRLLVLSACETSIINVQRAADEVVGMASAFLQAGAASVIASLWPVNDQATYLLMARFTNLYLDPRRNWTPARCLAEAQRWLREEATNRLLQDLSFNPAVPIPLADEPPMPNITLPTLPRASTTEQPDGEALLAGIRKRSLRYTQSGALAQIHAETARRDDLDALPYADPIYWAAFTVTGC